MNMCVPRAWTGSLSKLTSARKSPRLWNYQIEGTCIVFRSWQITGGFTFIVSFIIIVLLSITYEWLRKLQRAVDIQTAQQVTKKNATSAASDTPDTPLLGAIPKQYVCHLLSGSDAGMFSYDGSKVVLHHPTLGIRCRWGRGFAARFCMEYRHSCPSS